MATKLNDEDQALYNRLLRLIIPTLDEIAEDIRSGHQPMSVNRDKLQCQLMQLASLVHLEAFREGVEKSCEYQRDTMSLVSKHFDRHMP